MINDNLFSGLVAVSRHVICICSTFWIFSHINLNYIAGIKLLPFWAMSIAIYLIIRAFLLKPRAQNALIVLASLLFAAETAVILLFFFDIKGPLAAMFAVMAVGFTVTMSVMRCTEPISYARTINGMEFTILYFMFFLWAQTTEGIDFKYSMPLLFASAISIADIMHLRITGLDSGRSAGKTRSTAVIISVLAVTLIPIALFAIYGAKPLGMGITALIVTVVRCIDYICKIIINFISWLVSLLPDAEEEGYYEISPYEFDLESVNTEPEPDSKMLLIMQILFAVTAVVLAALVLYSLRNRKIGGKTQVGATGKVARKKLSLWRWIKSVLAAAKSKITVAFRIMMQRGSARELYLFVMKKGRLLGLSRASGETPCAFIKRAAQMAEYSSEEMRGALMLLSDELAISLYSNHGDRPFPKHQASLIRRELRKALHRAKLQLLKLRIKSMLSR